MKEIVEKLTKEGFEAYIVGGYVRDYLLGISSNDIDICTNATIDDLIRIFDGRGNYFKDFFAYHIKDGEYTYTITSFRKELSYKDNKPNKIESVRSLEEDIQRRDFTINTFAINPKNLLVDFLGARKDLDSKLIRVVGDTDKKLTEDKTRILRAIRLSCTLDFDLDPKILNFLEKHAKYLKDISDDIKVRELSKIFDSNNYFKFFYFAKKYHLDKYLNISYSQIKNSYNRYGVWSQIDTTLPLPKKYKKIINNIKLLLDKGDIGISDLKKYNDDVLYSAAYILGKVDKLKVLKDMESAHSLVDIDVSYDLMLRYINIKDYMKIYKQIERNIIEGNLLNNSHSIEEYLRRL